MLLLHRKYWPASPGLGWQTELCCWCFPGSQISRGESFLTPEPKVLDCLCACVRFEWTCFLVLTMWNPVSEWYHGSNVSSGVWINVRVGGDMSCSHSAALRQLPLRIARARVLLLHYICVGGHRLKPLRVTKRTPGSTLSATGHPCSSLIFLSHSCCKAHDICACHPLCRVLHVQGHAIACDALIAQPHFPSWHCQDWKNPTRRTQNMPSMLYLSEIYGYN